MRVFIGIDDTDNLESRGTGFLARRMAQEITGKGYGTVYSVTRHQLLVDERIPYTSHNSSACLEVETDDQDLLMDNCRNFLLQNAADGSDAGLCIMPVNEVNEDVISWGRKAKSEVLEMKGAESLASTLHLKLEGLTGTRCGIIGALAAVGLRKEGNDGRLLWIRGNKDLRELTPGPYEVSQLKNDYNIQLIRSVKGRILDADAIVEVDDWVRPVLKDNKVTLLVEDQITPNDYEWKTASKDYIKSVSQ